MFIRILILSLVMGQVHADSFDELLKRVRQQSSEELSASKARIEEFKTENANQEKLLEQASAELSRLLEESENLALEMEANEKLLATTEETLQRKVGDLGELFGAIRQVAGELDAEFESAITSVQYPERTQFLKTLAQSKALPNVAELEELWFIMLQEIGESGKTRQFNAPVIQRDGNLVDQSVIRVGAFTGLS
ncbi:MAG: MotA/TolQ/ExbB proton channel family protein, partial [Gammaproteobacteria bacterium]|nr:MotA/TolQ/ExbB proton channel family protein [Gammaproteobacteria bacterium]